MSRTQQSQTKKERELIVRHLAWLTKEEGRALLLRQERLQVKPGVHISESQDIKLALKTGSTQGGVSTLPQDLHPKGSAAPASGTLWYLLFPAAQHLSIL